MMSKSINCTMGFYEKAMYLLNKIGVLLEFISKIGSLRFLAPTIGLSKIKYKYCKLAG